MLNKPSTAHYKHNALLLSDYSKQIDYHIEHVRIKLGLSDVEA